MNSSNIVVCTLFEGDYHYGVAALINTLHASGFRGSVYAGYRGALPDWMLKHGASAPASSEGCFSLPVSGDLSVYLVELETKAHLTNYKPNFMLEILSKYEAKASAIFYIDPDICIVEKWQFFQDWVECGVAVCEDVNSPYPKNHPRRMGWRRYFAKYGYQLSYRSREYANGGLVGVPAEAIEFLNTWKRLQEAMSELIGGLEVAKLTRGKEFKSTGFARCFDASDQDALNAAIEVSQVSLSFIGREGMGFNQGSACALHAIGPNKPWQKSYFVDALKGIKLRRVDKEFWRSVRGPLKPYSTFTIFQKKAQILALAFISRFYRR